MDEAARNKNAAQAMLLKGSEMEKQDSRDTFKFVSRFRVLPKNFGEFDEHRIADVEEIVVATDTLPFEDYITCRKWHLVSSVFWNDGWFDVVVKFCRENGIQNSDWWELMLPAMEEGTLAVRAFLDSFVGETKGELFEDRDECAAFSDCWARQRFASGIVAGGADGGDGPHYRYD